MVLIPVLCPHCHSAQVIKGGQTKAGQQRDKCQNTACPHESFPRDRLYQGRAPASTEQSVERRLNGRGSRDPARVLQMRPPTVMHTLKKKEPARTAVHQPRRNALHPDEVDVVLQRVEEAAVDERWSDGGKTRAPRWLWHALDHHTGNTRDPRLAKAFFLGLAQGVELTASDPVYQVRERFIHDGRALYHTAVVERAAAIVHGWNCRRTGRPMKPLMLKWRGDNAAFPMVE